MGFSTDVISVGKYSIKCVMWSNNFRKFLMNIIRPHFLRDAELPYSGSNQENGQ